jgi:hypothetical protein
VKVVAIQVALATRLPVRAVESVDAEAAAPCRLLSSGTTSVGNGVEVNVSTP